MAIAHIYQPWRIAAAITFIGIMFRLLHIPYASEILLVGLAGIVILYPIHFWKKKKKEFLDYAKLFFVIFATLHYTFNVFHWNHGFLFTRLAQLSLLILIIAYLNDKYYADDKASKKERWETLLYVLAGVGIILGVILKILHWPYGNILMISGLITAAISVVLGSISSKK